MRADPASAAAWPSWLLRAGQWVCDTLGYPALQETGKSSHSRAAFARNLWFLGGRSGGGRWDVLFLLRLQMMLEETAHCPAPF